MINFDNYQKIKVSKLKVGDIVQVMPWTLMRREFYKDEDGDIVVGTNYFTKDMKRFCKLYYRIGEIVYHDMRGGTLFKLKYDGLNPNEDLDSDLDLTENWLGLDGSVYHFNVAMLIGLRPSQVKLINKDTRCFDEALL